MRPRLVVPALAAALMAACGGSDGPTGGGEGKVTVEAARAAHDSMGVAGGEITATGENGVSYTLTVPAGALVRPTKITMTPIAAEEGLPLSGGFAAGVTLEPSGLHFAQAARLAISHLPAAPAGEQLVGLTFEGDGDSLGLTPLFDSSGVVRTFITHFSGATIGFGTTADVQLLLQAVTTGVASQAFINQISALLGPPPASDATLVAVFKQWFASVIRPELQNAGSDAELLIAVADYDQWFGDALALGLLGSLSPEQVQAAQAVAPALRNAITGNNDVCRTNHDVQAMLNVMFWQGKAQYFRVDNAAEQLDQATVLNNLCAKVKEASHSLADPLPIGQAKTLDVTFMLEFSDGTRAPNPLFQATVTATGATIQNPQGFTDSAATWGGSVITAQQSSVTIVATACFLEPGTSTVTPICGIDNIAIGSQQFTQVQASADVTVAGDAACQDVHGSTGLSAATISASKVCTHAGANYQLSASSNATLINGDLAASYSQQTGTQTGGETGNGGGSAVIDDRVEIDAPGLAGTQGTFTVAFEISGQIAASGGSSRQFSGTSWSALGAVFALGGGTGQNLFPAANGAVTNAGTVVGPPLPATLRSPVPITFTFGTPFLIHYQVQILSQGQAGLVPAAASGSIHYRWLGMSGLPAGAVVHSDSGIDWSQASP